MGDGWLVLILTEDEIRSLVGHVEAAAAARAAFRAMHRGSAIVPDVMLVDLGSDRGDVHVKCAYLHDQSEWALKVASSFHGNRRDGRPALSGLTLAFDATHGALRALLADNGYLTELRTAAAGALTVELLARADATRVAMIGAGSQARYQLAALASARPVASVALFSRSRAGADAVAAWWRALGGAIEVHDTCEAAVADADIVYTTTPAREAVLRGAWLRPGAHVVAVGADAHHKRELDGEVFTRAGCVAVDDIRQATAFGDTSHAVREGHVRTERLVTFGALLAGDAVGRTASDEITVADLTGVGAQDAAIAAATLARALRAAVGTEFDTTPADRSGDVALPPAPA